MIVHRYFRTQTEPETYHNRAKETGQPIVLYGRTRGCPQSHHAVTINQSIVSDVCFLQKERPRE
jgi:hypothetical protein